MRAVTVLTIGLVAFASSGHLSAAAELKIARSNASHSPNMAT